MIFLFKDMRGGYQRAAWRKYQFRNVTGLWIKWLMMRCLLSASELYKKQWKRHGPLHGLSLRPKTTSETLSARNTRCVPTWFFLLTLRTCGPRLRCFPNKEPNPSSLNNTGLFLSFSCVCPPAAGFALHHSYSRPSLMKHSPSGTCCSLWQPEWESSVQSFRQQQLNAPAPKWPVFKEAASKQIIPFDSYGDVNKKKKKSNYLLLELGKNFYKWSWKKQKFRAYQCFTSWKCAYQFTERGFSTDVSVTQSPLPVRKQGLSPLQGRRCFLRPAKYYIPNHMFHIHSVYPKN